MQSIRNSWQIYATLALTIGAALTALSYPFVQHSCSECEYVSRYWYPDLYMVGAAYYCLLSAALWRFKINKWTLFALYVALGVHSLLIAKLFSLQLFCILCIGCAACIGLACLIAAEWPVRSATLAVLTGVTLIGVVSYARHDIGRLKKEAQIKAAIHFDKLELSGKTRVPLYVFEEPSCWACRQFNDLYAPRLISKYDRNIDIRILEAPPTIPTPTLVVGGDHPLLIDRIPNWFDLTGALETRIQHLRPRSVASEGQMH